MRQERSANTFAYYFFDKIIKQVCIITIILFIKTAQHVFIAPFRDLKTSSQTIICKLQYTYRWQRAEGGCVLSREKA